MSRSLVHLCRSVTMASAFLLTLASAGPVGWRYDGTGRFPGPAPVTSWDVATGKNILWRTPMPRWGNASPVVVVGKVIVTGEPDRVYALDAATGQQVWETDISLLHLLGDEGQPLRARKAEKDALELKTWEIDRQVDALDELDDEASKEKAKALKAEARDAAKRIKELEAELSEPTGTLKQKWRTIGYSMATPVTDGTHVWVKSGTGAVACLELATGRISWMKKIDPDPYETSVTSPILLDTPPKPLLILSRVVYDAERKYQNEKTERSKNLLAFEAATGDLVWESAGLPTAGWGSGSPLLMEVDHVAVVVSDSGDVVRATDGFHLKERIALGGSSSAVADGNVAYICDDKEIRAVRLTWSGSSKIEATELWRRVIVQESANSFGLWSSPLLAGGRLFAVDGLAHGLVLDAASGEVLHDFSPLEYTGRKAEVYASLAEAGGKVVVASMKKGYVSIFELSADGQPVVEVSAFDETLFSSPFIADGRIYFRTQDAVYCIGTK